MQRLRQQEAGDKEFAPETKDAPRALVLTPTAELCQQVLSVARGLARAAPVRSCAITGAHSTLTVPLSPSLCLGSVHVGWAAVVQGLVRSALQSPRSLPAAPG